MKEKLPKDWKKVLLWFVGVVLFTIVLFFFSQNELDNYDTGYVSADKDRLEVGDPEYVEYENIKTNDTYIKTKGNSKYSQIKVKNNSSETLYDIRIDLKEQEMNNPSEFIVPSYSIEVLEPGESAILSARHENLKEGEKLEIDRYSYCDGKGKSYEVTKRIEDGKVKLGISSNRDDEFYKYHDITPKVDAISFKYISEKEENNKVYYELELKNNSSIEVDKINLTLNEEFDGNIVGSYYVGYNGKLKPGETGIVKFNTNKDIKLDMVYYGYVTYNEPDKEESISNYYIYINQGKYKFYNYEDYEVSSRRTLYLSISNVVVISSFWILDVFSNRMKNKGILENNEEYITRSKILSRIKIAIFILYTIFLLLVTF